MRWFTYDSAIAVSIRLKAAVLMGGLLLVASLTACGGNSTEDAGAPADLSIATWTAEVTKSSCDDFASEAVGSYVMQSNYWNKATCPGTQCLDFNTATGAFSVTQGPPACGNNVASYPNMLYGCSFGTCSPKSMLPMPVSNLSTVTSSWDFAINGGTKDQYNVAYDVWFCPDNNCGTNGFPKGLEMMIWLDYKNVHGWQDHLGTVNLAGRSWDVWVKKDMLAGNTTETWTYLVYILRGPMVSSVKDLDLNAFFGDATTRGYVKSSWYLYAIQAGVELRTGGIPYNNNSFSVAINGVTPSTVPTPNAGPSCDGGAPTAEGLLTVADSYVTAGSLHGYGSAWTWVGPTSSAIACAAPACTASATGAVSCTPAFPPSALCTAGSITADKTYQSVAGVGFNLNQDLAVAGNADGSLVDMDAGDVADGGATSTMGTITIPSSITISVAKSGTLTGNSTLRAQLTDPNEVAYCYGGSLAEPVPIEKFNTQCWNNKGEWATPSTAFKKLDVIVPSSAATEQDFAFCITNVTVQ